MLCAVDEANLRRFGKYVRCAVSDCDPDVTVVP